MVFAAEAALIALREGLEAFLIAGILLGFVVKLGRPDAKKWVWIGLAAGVAASLALGLAVRFFLLAPFEDGGGAEWFELAAALTAVAVLTYMVFWMWKHTRGLMAGLRKKVGAALDRNALWVVAGLVFVTVLREGLEVVLFYGALANRYDAWELAWSGLVGAVVSIGLVVAILRSTFHLNLAKFFAVTGVLLVFVAAGLLVHSVHAATAVGLLPQQPALWDTGGAIPDDRADGRILHAMLGYTSAPTLLQALLYFGYLFGVGGAYLHSLGAFRRRGTGTVRRVPVAAVALLVLLAGAATAYGAANPAGFVDDDHHGPRAEALAHGETYLDLAQRLDEANLTIGVIIRDHGEPVEYNATTYASFRQFIIDIWPYTGLPPELLTADQGTVLLDAAHPFATQPRTDADLVDAWLEPWNLAAAPVGDPLEQGTLDDFCRHSPQFYMVPGAGPGLGEGDVLEMLGLCVYRDWVKMQNHSPRHAAGAHAWAYLETHLRNHLGDRVEVVWTHGVDPKVSPEETPEAAARRLVEADVDVVFDAYQSSVHSDAMNTCMMAPHMEHALRQAGYRGPVVPVGQAGHHPLWAQAAVDHVATLLPDYAPGDPVSVHLVQHGATPGSANPCADAEGTPDQYHANLERQYELGRDALAARFPNLTIRSVYGAGADAPDDGVLSPLEAVDADRADGIQRAVMVPYEFWGDAMDNLVNLRESLGFEPADAPYYDADGRTRLTVRGVEVLVTSAEYETYTKCDALLEVLALTIQSHLDETL